MLILSAKLFVILCYHFNANLDPKSFKAHWLIYVESDLILQNSTLYPGYIYVFCMDCGKKNTDYLRILARFYNETDCVYCAVRTESLNIILNNLSPSRVSS